MKKLILTLMTVMSMAFAGLAFAACGGGETSSESCAHTNVSEKVTNATCTQEGLITKTCVECTSIVSTEKTPALGHDFMEGETFEATCSTPKTFVQQCERCGESETTELSAALGHNFVFVEEIDASCLAPASTRYECDRDGCTAEKTENVEGSKALGHNYVVLEGQSTEPTCTTPGETFYKCDRDGCGDEYSEVEAPFGHTPEGAGVETAPTCTLKGYTTYHCVTCTQDYKQDYVPELGHTLEAGTSVVASCANMGYDRMCCSRTDCDYEEKSNVVANSAHTFNSEGVCTVCEKGATEAFALECADTEIYAIEQKDSYYLVSAPSYTLWTKVMMPVSVLEALYAQNIYSFTIMIGSKSDSEAKAMSARVQGGTAVNLNVSPSELKELCSYTFADAEGIFESAKNGILIEVYYKVMGEENAVLGAPRATSYAISFEYDVLFDIENTKSYFKTSLPFTYNGSTFSFTNINTRGNNTIVLRQELMQYYLDNGYKTMNIMVSTAEGQHYAKNVTVRYGDGQTATTGDTNSYTASLVDLSLEALASGDVKVDIYAVDNYGTAWAPTAPLDQILLTLTFEKEKSPVTAFISGNGVITDYVSDIPVTETEPVIDGTMEKIVYTFTVENNKYAFINFDAKIINAMMEKGYTSVKFDFTVPSGRYIHSELQGTGIEKVTKAYGETLDVSKVSFDLVSLTKDGTYNIRFMFAVETEVTVTTTYAKNVVAYAGTEFKTVTAADPVYDETAGTATMSYTLNVINHTYTYICFDAGFINKMMAEGYTKVQFIVSQPTKAYIHALLKGTGIDANGIKKEHGAAAAQVFEEITLTENATYNICFYMGAITDMTVKAVFSK